MSRGWRGIGYNWVIRNNEKAIIETGRDVDLIPGGQKQRVMIVMALACNPKLLIADEPTTAISKIKS